MLQQDFKLTHEESIKKIIIDKNSLSVSLAKVDETLIGKSINADFIKKISDDFIKELQKIILENPNIIKINLEGMKCSDRHLENLTSYIENLKHLETLSLTNNKIELLRAPNFIEILKIIPKLSKIDFSGNEISSRGLEDILQIVKISPNIKILNLRSINITDINSQILSQNLKENTTLKKLDLSFNRNLNDDSFIEMLKYNTTVLSIKITNFQFRENQNIFIEKLNRNKKINKFIEENSSIFDEKILAKIINASVRIQEGVAKEYDFLALQEAFDNRYLFKNPLNQMEAKEKIFQFYRELNIDENSIETIKNLALDKNHASQKPQNKIPASIIKKMLVNCFGLGR